MNTAHQRSVADPLRTMWENLGGPLPSAPMDREGICARCAVTSSTASRLKVVVSDKFTGWDLYIGDPDPVWCVACTWGHTVTELRTRPWLITTQHSQQPTRQTLAETLANPLGPTTALTVPIARQKHILPAARWEHVTTDNRSLTWTLVEATRFRIVQRLRSLGFSESALKEPVPRFEQLIALDRSLISAVVEDWESLTPWRADDIYIHLACVGSRPEDTRTHV